LEQTGLRTAAFLQALAQISGGGGKKSLLSKSILFDSKVWIPRRAAFPAGIAQ